MHHNSFVVRIHCRREKLTLFHVEQTLLKYSQAKTEKRTVPQVHRFEENRRKVRRKHLALYDLSIVLIFLFCFWNMNKNVRLIRVRIIIEFSWSLYERESKAYPIVLPFLLSSSSSSSESVSVSVERDSSSFSSFDFLLASTVLVVKPTDKRTSKQVMNIQLKCITIDIQYLTMTSQVLKHRSLVGGWIDHKDIYGCKVRYTTNEQICVCVCEAIWRCKRQMDGEDGW